ncbi:PH domain-containing protein [Streptomyces sp. NPDC090301]|uniref:PH domain-containing protein n=1 Tax=Streptomyces sp. NPDC090301 TaxID=3154975 RepID=UPI003426048A
MMNHSSPRQAPASAHTLGSAGQRIVLIVVGGVFGLLGAVGLTGAADPAGVVIYSVVLAAGLWLAFRGGLVGLRVDASGITERGLGRSRTVSWCAVREVAVSTQGLGPARTGSPGLVLKDGRSLPLTAIASYSSRTLQADLALLTSAHTAHLGACGACASPGSGKR